KLTRVSLNTENGRLAQIILTARGELVAVISDVTLQLTHETILASALVWLEKLSRRKKDPIKAVSIAAEKKQARNLRKLHALIRIPEKISVIELAVNGDKMSAREMRTLRMPDLWRDRSAKLRIPSELIVSRTARKLIDIS